MKRFLFALFFVGLSVTAARPQMTIFVVRHAEKADASENASLSEIGRARAESLAMTLKDSNIAAIYATEFKRTQETAASLARALGLEVTIVPASQTESLAAKLKMTNGNTLVVGHGNTIPGLLKALGIAKPVTINDADYDNLYVVVLGEKPQLIRLHYH